MQISPLDGWVAEQLGLPDQQELSIESLRNYQWICLNKTLRHVALNSPFYRQRIEGFQSLTNLSDLKYLPFTTSLDLVEQGLQMLAVSQGEIERIVTLRSSGTTGKPKRIYFTRSDLERTRSFFRCGMSQMLKAGDRVLVLLPGELPDSAGRLLADALQVAGIESEVFGLVHDPEQVAMLLASKSFDCVVGIPIQILGVVRHPLAAVPHGRIGSVFLTSDYVPSALVREIRHRWNCPAINHYGMTELGLTGGVECQALSGYHLREPDLYFEVIDPLTGCGLPAGDLGEVVVTTLTRTGMPLIRYRTGDIARFIPDPCPCGSCLPRLSKLQGRLAGKVDIGGPLKLAMPELDEALLSLPGLVNFTATLSTKESGLSTLQITIEARPGVEQQTRNNVDRRLPTIPALRAAVVNGGLSLRPTSVAKHSLPVSATAKRLIEQPEKEHVSLETIN